MRGHSLKLPEIVYVGMQVETNTLAKVYIDTEQSVFWPKTFSYKQVGLMIEFKEHEELINKSEICPW